MNRLLPGLLLTCCGLAAAAEIPAANLSHLAWRSIGPFRGGRTLAVAGAPDDALTFYLGSVNGGVWRTRDAGRTWQPIFDGQPIGSIGALAVAPTDPKRLYVGSGECDMRSDISQGNGFYRSDDGGTHWQHLGLERSQQICRIVVDPGNAERLWVAVLGRPYAANPERGVFRSTDGGRNWQRVLAKGDDVGAIDLVAEPGHPEVLYAALWQTRRTPWSIYPPSMGPGSDVMKSTDGGTTWTSLAGHGLPSHHGRVGLAISPKAPERVYAIVDHETDGGLYRSDDGGAHFAKASGDTRLWTRGWYFGEVAVDPDDADSVFVPNTVLLHSTDGGKTFAPVRGDATGDDFHALWIDRDHPERRILGTDQGALVSLNRGATWSSWHNQPTAQFYNVATDNRFPYFVYGSQQDSGAAGVPSRTAGVDAINVTRFREITAGGESDNVAPDPDDPDVIFGGRVDRLDLKSEQVHSIDPTLAFPDQNRRTWTLPLVFSPRDHDALYFANQTLYRTRDQGEHWDRISPDLTRAAPADPPNLDAVTAANNLQMGPRRGVIYAIAPSRAADGDLWVGTDDGKIWRSRDDGGHWDDVTPKSLTAWSKVGTLDTVPFDADTAYAAIDRHRLDDFSPHILVTHDGGKTWSERVSGIAGDQAINVVKADPVRSGLLYAGSERGVWVSFDDGGRWQPLQAGLPTTSVRDLEVKDADLVIATHGRGFYVLDDIAALRQAADTVATRLYAPSPAHRQRPAEFTGTPFPKEEPAAPNPPAGAYIDYVLSAPATSVVLEIHDAAGKRVRRYDSADRASAYDPAKAGTAPEWFQAAIALSTAVGAHRFAWPYTYAPLPDLAEDGDGAWAPPGAYRITLTVDGTSFEQPLTLLPDPRVKLGDADYRHQFELANAVADARAGIVRRSAEAKAMLKAIAAQRGHWPAALAKPAGALEGRIHALSGIVPSANPANTWWLPPKSMDSLRFVQDGLDRLARAIDGADAAVTPDAVTGLIDYRSRAEVIGRRWDELRNGDWAGFNAKLRAAGVAELSLETKP